MSKRNRNLAISIIIPIIYLALIFIVIAGYLEILVIPDLAIIILLVIGLVFTVAIAVYYILRKILASQKKKKEQERRNYMQQQREVEELDGPITRGEPVTSTPRINRNNITYKHRTEDDITYISQQLIFSGDKSNQTCGICKLEIRKKQKVYQCPNCFTLFHDDHFEEWIQNDTSCPICDYNFKNFIR